MANWCSNVVSFSGDKNQLKQVMKLFREMGRKCKKQMRGQLPDFLSKDQLHFFDIYVKKDKLFTLTKGEPNNEALKEIAGYFKLDFINRFDDLPMGLFGEAKYTNGNMRLVCLDTFDFQHYEYNREREVYVYGGDSYEDEWPIFNKLLDRKISLVERNEIQDFSEKDEQEDLFKTTSRITRQELTSYYGDMGDGDLLLKFAEYKNFDAALAVFQNLDEQSVIEIGNFFIQGYRHEQELYKTRHKYIAVSFLMHVLNDWNEIAGRQSGDSIKQSDNEIFTELGRLLKR